MNTEDTSLDNGSLLCLESDIATSALLYAFTFLAGLLAPWLRQTDASNFSRELPTYESFFVAGWLIVLNFRSSPRHSAMERISADYAFVHDATISPIIALMIIIDSMHTIAS